MRTLALSLVLLAACGPSSELATGGSFLTEGASLEALVLDFANHATHDDLNAVINSNAALAVESARPIGSLTDLAIVSYVGDATLEALLAHVAPSEAAAGAGFWEEVLLSATEAAATLDMANALDASRLQCGVGLTSTMAERVIAARPLATLDALVDIPYFGATQLRRFKGAATWWLAGGTSGTAFDCVFFSAEQESAALTFVNEASWSELCSVGGCDFGGWTLQMNVITAGRPWASLQSVAAASGIGNWTMTLIRTGADRVLAEIAVLGVDSLLRMNTGEVSSGYVRLEPMRVLEMLTIGRFYKPGTGRSIGPTCGRVADWDDATPDEPGHSALVCEIDFSPNLPLENAFASGAPYAPGELQWLRHDGQVILYDPATYDFD